MQFAEKLVEYWLKRLTRFAYYQLDADLKRSAADVAHDALAICWRGVAEGAWTRSEEDEIADFGPSLYRTVRQLALNANRKHRPKSEADIDFELVARVDRDSDPAALAEHTERVRAVHNSVTGLREPYRTVVVLRYIEEQSAEDVARIMGIPVGTVKSRAARGLEMLRPKLAGWYEDMSAHRPADGLDGGRS